MRRKTIRYMETRQPGYYPYYKLQWWNPVSFCWQVLNKARFDSPTAALAAQGQLPELAKGQPLRVVEVNERGEIPLVVPCSN